jgi:hypothetical protein
MVLARSSSKRIFPALPWRQPSTTLREVGEATHIGANLACSFHVRLFIIIAYKPSTTQNGTEKKKPGKQLHSSSNKIKKKEEEKINGDKK